MGDRTDTTCDEARRRRAGLVDKLRERGSIRTAAVGDAMLAVPRHRFVPEAPLRAAYADDAFVTKRNNEGDALSSASQPAIVAEMLEQLDVGPGHKVLEIGAGTGYNAALLDSLVGPDGSVATVDLDADTVKRAREALDAVGHGRVRVVQGDGEAGLADGAPYDRIIVTVGTWDLPPAWWDQLAEGGRLVAPLQIRGSEHSVAFDYTDGVLRSRSVIACGFMPMRGIGSHESQAVELSEGRIITFHADKEVEAAGARGVLDERGTTVWTGVRITPGEDTAQLSLWLACAFSGYGRMSAPFGDHGKPRLMLRWGNPAVADGAAFAYVACRRGPDVNGASGSDIEVGVCGHGPGGAALAGRVAAEVAVWDRECRGDVRLQIEAYRAGVGPTVEGRFVVPKRHSRLAIRLA
ncbi:methyltransferase, FxLD system [Glycomyces tenuis]|uniref:methyltransferase, FxLD system n=1 Tax=Glycomyces tenuis TaxID=58116 RepID=UPI00042728ED|nr:methyltransferase, FxLD system [Glycomyces tenuis]